MLINEDELRSSKYKIQGSFENHQKQYIQTNNTDKYLILLVSHSTHS